MANWKSGKKNTASTQLGETEGVGDGGRAGGPAKQIECGANKFTFIPADWLASSAKASRMAGRQLLYHLNPQNDNYFRQALSEQQLPSAESSKSLALFLEAEDSIKKKASWGGQKVHLSPAWGQIVRLSTSVHDWSDVPTPVVHIILNVRLEKT